MKMMRKAVPMILVMVLLLMTLAGCGGTTTTTTPTPAPAEPDVVAPEDREPIQIATKVTAEQYILGEMLSILIEEKLGYPTEITKGLADSNIVQPALENGDVDLYPDYTGSCWANILGYDPTGVSNDEMFAGLKEEYEQKFGITWLGLYGFNNTYGVVVDKTFAETHGLKTISDLAAISEEVRFGANPTYIERPDALPALSEAYGLNFKEIVEVDISLRYATIENGEADASVAFTTDAQLAVGNVVLLEDDLNAQNAYYCSTIVRQDTLAEYEGLEETLMLMNGLINDAEMAAMNYEVEIEGRDEYEVAREYLVNKGLLEA